MHINHSNLCLINYYAIKVTQTYRFKIFLIVNLPILIILFLDNTKSDYLLNINYVSSHYLLIMVNTMKKTLYTKAHFKLGIP